MADEKVYVLAKALTAHGVDEKLVWETAKTCPNRHAVEKDAKSGDLCWECFLDRPAPWMESVTHYQFNTSNPEWHSEWRIGKAPRDLTDPTNLLPVLEAFADANQIIDVAPNFHRNTQKGMWEGSLALYVRTPSNREDVSNDYDGYGPTWGHAVFNALVAAVTEEVRADA